MTAEVERSVHDALCVVKRTLESGFVVAGGGCCEAALSIHLEKFGTKFVDFFLVNFRLVKNKLPFLSSEML